MRQFLMSCALCAIALPAAAEETSLYRCLDSAGVIMLTDRPCDAVPNAVSNAGPNTLPYSGRTGVVKEYFVLPPSEQGRNRWVYKPRASVPPKVDVQTLRMARQALDLRDKVASAR